jgi:hypothetical protein
MSALDRMSAGLRTGCVDAASSASCVRSLNCRKRANIRSLWEWDRFGHKEWDVTRRHSGWGSNRAFTFHRRQTWTRNGSFRHEIEFCLVVSQGAERQGAKIWRLCLCVVKSPNWFHCGLFIYFEDDTDRERSRADISLANCVKRNRVEYEDPA